MAKKKGFKRVSVSVPAEVWDEVIFVAGRMGISRSSLVTEALEGMVSAVVPLVKMTPKQPTPADVRRLRGASVELIKTKIAETMALLEAD